MAALVLVAIFTGGSTPNNNDPVTKVVSYYTAHRTGTEVSSVLWALGSVFLVFFAVGLAARVRAGGAPGWLAHGLVAGAVAAMLGSLPLLTFQFILADDIKFLSAGSVQTLNVLANDFFLPYVAGFVVFAVIAGLAAAAGRAPARWMGWLLFAIGILCAVPPLSWFASLAVLLWSLAAGIWLAAQKPAAPVPATAPDVTLTAA